jgi:hypothetical protein
VTTSSWYSSQRSDRGLRSRGAFESHLGHLAGDPSERLHDTTRGDVLLSPPPRWEYAESQWRARSSVVRCGVDTMLSVWGVEGEGDGLVERQRPAFLPSLGEGGFVELSSDGEERPLVHLPDPRGHTTNLFAEKLRPGEEPGGHVCSSNGGEKLVEIAEALCDPATSAVVAVDAHLLVQHLEGGADAALIEGKSRQLTELERRHALVGLCAGPIEDVLVQCTAAFAVTELAVRPREGIRCQQDGVVVV